MDKAKLICKIPPGVVVFDFNPDEFHVNRTASTRQMPSTSSNGGSPAGSTGSIFRGAPQAKITFKALLYGGDTKARCDTLLGWMSPSNSGLLGALAGAALSAISGGAINLSSSLPSLTFQWGPPMAGFVYECKMTSCNITYKRFDSSGIPVRAEVDIGLEEQPSLLSSLPTNPTSGGLPGRQAHVVSDGDSLPSIATRAYGRPGAWRALADANGIDDPFRVRPGRTVYLPSPDEIAAGAR